ncbi:MAG: SdpI family protein [Gemmatimonadota bacterium]
MRRPWIAPVVIAAMLAASLLAFPSLPREIPTHWNLRWEADGWMAKWPGAFLFPGLGLLVWLLLLFLPRIDPRRQHYERFRETYWLLVNWIVLLIAFIEVLSFGEALGWPIVGPRLMLVALGVVLIAIGNYLPRVRSNWWIGIRTPWTLESESVWKATHRLAGRCFVGAGVTFLLTIVAPARLRGWIAGTAVMLAAVVPLVFSYVAFRRERSKGVA